MIADIAFTWLDFLTVILLAFAIVMVLAGLFTAYFGNGKSRIAGVLMILVGLIVGGVWIYLCTGDNPIIKDINIWNVFWNALVNLIGILVGALVAVVIFLIAVLKS